MRLLQRHFPAETQDIEKVWNHEVKIRTFPIAEISPISDDAGAECRVRSDAKIDPQRVAHLQKGPGPLIHLAAMPVACTKNIRNRIDVSIRLINERMAFRRGHCCHQKLRSFRTATGFEGNFAVRAGGESQMEVAINKLAHGLDRGRQRSRLPCPAVKADDMVIELRLPNRRGGEFPVSHGAYGA